MTLFPILLLEGAGDLLVVSRDRVECIVRDTFR